MCYLANLWGYRSAFIWKWIYLLCWEIIIAKYVNFDRVPVSPFDWVTQTFISFEFRSIGGSWTPSDSASFPDIPLILWLYAFLSCSHFSDCFQLTRQKSGLVLVQLEDRELFRFCFHSNIWNLGGYGWSYVISIFWLVWNWTVSSVCFWTGLRISNDRSRRFPPPWKDWFISFLDYEDNLNPPVWFCLKCMHSDFEVSSVPSYAAWLFF